MGLLSRFRREDDADRGEITKRTLDRKERETRMLVERVRLLEAQAAVFDLKQATK